MRDWVNDHMPRWLKRRLGLVSPSAVFNVPITWDPEPFGEWHAARLHEAAERQRQAQSLALDRMWLDAVRDPRLNVVMRSVPTDPL